MSSSAGRPNEWLRPNLINGRSAPVIQVALWSGMFAIFLYSPVTQMTDSQYAKLTAESILHHHTPDPSSYTIKDCRKHLPFDTTGGGHAYQLARTNGRLLYGFPHGTSILSIPFVAMMDLLGISPATQDGQYNFRGESIINRLLPMLLMASLVVVLFRTALLMLNWRWSVVVAIGAGLGTSIWSTASRGMWAHTREIMLGGLVVYHLLASAVRGTSVRPFLLAMLLSLMVFVRPTRGDRRRRRQHLSLDATAERTDPFCDRRRDRFACVCDVFVANLRYLGALCLLERRSARNRNGRAAPPDGRRWPCAGFRLRTSSAPCAGEWT